MMGAQQTILVSLKEQFLCAVHTNSEMGGPAKNHHTFKQCAPG